MNITRENSGNVSAVIKVTIEKPDYEKTVEAKLKEYRQKASIPGFRPGKAPIGLIKKRFEKPLMVEEINALLSHNLTSYIVEQKLQVLGEPMASIEHQKPIDWDNDESFEFAFDLALAPEIDVPLSESDSLKYYTIAVTEEMIDQQVEMIRSQMGQNKTSESVTEKSLVRGNFVELTEEGAEKEDGIKADAVMLAVDLIKDETVKSQFLGKTAGETLTFDPVKAYQDRHEVGHLLKISHEQADNLNSNFNFTMTEILDFEKAELNEELYKKIYGEETEIKTEAELRAKLKEEIANSLLQSSDRRFAFDTRNALIEKVKPELPEDLLKRWLKETNQQISEEEIEKDFEGFLQDLRWQLIKDFLIKQNELKVEDEEAFNLAKQIAHAQYSQYGIYNAPDDQLESFAKMILEKPEEKERLYTKILEDKAIEVVKSKVTLDSKEISREAFEALA